MDDAASCRAAPTRAPDGRSPPRAGPLVNTGRLGRPHLCVVVDTEEDFDWNRSFSRTNTSVASFHNLDRVQTVFERHGVRPCYLASYPIMVDGRAADTLRRWVEQDRCIVGAHLHPWVTPPHEEVVCLANSFPCNLSEDLERRKLKVLSDVVLERLGERPAVYKAGRYGIRLDRAKMLTELGFLVDTSVLPFRDYSGLGGGPNFFSCPAQPFWSPEDGRLLHLPMTHGLIGPLRRVAGSGADRLLFSAASQRRHIPGMLSHLGLLERIMLTPEGRTLDDMRRVVRKLAARGQSVFALTMHSPSFTPGRTPYARNPAEADALLDRLDQFLRFFRTELDGVALTPVQLRDIFLAG